MGNECDVVVIGGGLSGLAAARSLVASGVDSTIVLEARDEPGGKCHLRSVAGVPVDAGGMFTGPGQHHLKGLAEAYGISTYPTGAPGSIVRYFEGEMRYSEPHEPELEGAAQDELARALKKFESLCDHVDPSAPWSSAEAGRLDAMSVENWIDEQTADPAVRLALARRFKTSAAAASQLSMLAMAAFVSSCGGWGVFETELDELFVGGAGQIPARVAEELGSRVRLGWPVNRISWDAEGVRVEGANEVVTARRAIIAMSPADARRIHFAPGLTTRREQLHRAWFSASIIKTMLVYERPFWRESTSDRPALTGFASSDEGGPHTVVDASPPDGSVGVLGAMIRLLGEGQRFNISHDVLDDPEARRARLLENLVRMYGPEAAIPLGVGETHWFHEPYISGCLGWAPPGLLTQCGEALRAPIGPIHWAGSESADTWSNHLNGAVQAGERAAAEVAAELAQRG
ncbi:flavin monoamine oxidase family protein [Streptomyces carpinensis]|uniref:FAD-dependent oxidoreductase n=1 Tax=Streptomyces carpinensis TaxID=66369 RepID=A0ABV1VV58_9ACTN|nr:FAD-dependent oxidoreductase [Streptomyces carpinensis]